jgi:predicted nucleic acid-binding protein
MIIVDSSVWIDYYEGRENAHTLWLENESRSKRVGLTDRTFCEVLQGTRRDADFASRLLELSKFDIHDTGGEVLAILSARNYRQLREVGVTIRTAVDCLIATFCISQGHTLLHRDRDFDAFEKHFGLRVIHPQTH